MCVYVCVCVAAIIVWDGGRGVIVNAKESQVHKPPPGLCQNSSVKLETRMYCISVHSYTTEVIVFPVLGFHY